MKKTFSFVLMLGLLFGVNGPVFAQTPDDSLEQVNTVSETSSEAVSLPNFYDPDEMNRLIGNAQDAMNKLAASKNGGDTDLWTQLIKTINDLLGGGLYPGGGGSGTLTGVSTGADTGVITGVTSGTKTGSGAGTAVSTGTSASTGTATGSATGGQLTTASSEADFEAAGAKFSGARWTPAGGKPGDSEGKWQMPTFGFPDWFGRIQQALIEHKPWTDEDREANKLIETYARKKAMELNGGVLHSTFFEFFHFLGASAYNGQAGPLGGDGKNKIWCAGASRGTYMRGIQPYAMKGGYADWLNKGKGRKFWDSSKAKAQQNLQAGDVITIGHKDTGKDQHVATVVGVKGNKVLYVSGNAGGAVDGYGTVRIEEIDLSRINQVERLSQLSKEKLEAMSPEELEAAGIVKK